MSFLISTRAELIKTKRSASFWICVFLALALFPLIFFIDLYTGAGKKLSEAPVISLGNTFWAGLAGIFSFLLPMFVILICSLIPQIEYKNNAWKQVFASPQSLGNIFFSKFFTIHLMILFLFLLFNLFMILSAVVANLIISKYVFLKNPIDWDNTIETEFAYLFICSGNYCHTILAEPPF